MLAGLVHVGQCVTESHKNIFNASTAWGISFLHRNTKNRMNEWHSKQTKALVHIIFKVVIHKSVKLANMCQIQVIYSKALCW